MKIGFIGLGILALSVLKLIGVLDWGWLWIIFTPIVGVIGFWLLIVFMLGFIAFISTQIKYRRSGW